MGDGMSHGRDYGPFLSKHGPPIVSKEGKPVTLWCLCGHKASGHTENGACLECRAIEEMVQPCNSFQPRT